MQKSLYFHWHTNFACVHIVIFLSWSSLFLLLLYASFLSDSIGSANGPACFLFELCLICYVSSPSCLFFGLSLRFLFWNDSYSWLCFLYRNDIYSGLCFLYWRKLSLDSSFVTGIIYIPDSAFFTVSWLCFSTKFKTFYTVDRLAFWYLASIINIK